MEPVNASSREQVVWRAGRRWVLLDAAGHELLADGAPDWFNLDGDARATLVKRNPKRTVHRVEFAGRVLYVKTSRAKGTAGRIRMRLTGSPAKGECRVATYAAAHGVPAVRFYARASSAGGSAVLTVSPEVHEAVTLADALIAARSNSQRCNELLAAAAELIAKAHNAAFLHPDNHPGNILVQDESTGMPRCLYTDLHGVRIGLAVTERDAARNLAAIDQWLSQRATRTQRLRAFRRYAGLRVPRMGTVAARRLLRLTLRASIRHAHSLYRKRDSRIGGDDAYFMTLPLQGGWRAWITLRQRPATMAITDSTPPSTRDDAEQLVESRLHTNPQSSLPALIDHTDTERFYPPSAWSALWWRITGSPAKKRYGAAMQIAHRDLPCQSAIACLEHRSGMGIDQSAWITANLRDATPIIQWLANPANAQHRRQILEQSGRLLADTFDRGIVPTGSVIASLVVARTVDGCPLAVWSRLPARALRKPVPESVRMWGLSRLANELGVDTGAGRIGIARALRAYRRSAGLVRSGTDAHVTSKVASKRNG